MKKIKKAEVVCNFMVEASSFHSDIQREVPYWGCEVKPRGVTMYHPGRCDQEECLFQKIWWAIDPEEASEAGK